MGSYDGAETCELIGLYILNKINHIIDYKDVGLGSIEEPFTNRS